MADRPTYSLGGLDDPVLGDLPVMVRAQVTQTIMTQLLAEVVGYGCGGEIILPPGFRERVGSVKRTIQTTFLDDESYRVVVVDMPDEIIHIAQATRWIRDAVFYEVTEEDSGSGYTGMRRLLTTTANSRGWVISVRTEMVRRHAGGWAPAPPSHRQIVEAPNEAFGKESGDA